MGSGASERKEGGKEGTEGGKLARDESAAYLPPINAPNVDAVPPNYHAAALLFGGSRIPKDGELEVGQSVAIMTEIG